MKRFLILPIIFFTLYSCGPAAESREQMHSRAKTIADSMANLIKVAMDEAEMPAGGQPMIMPHPATPTAAAQTTIAPPKK
jgi:hypothetical protein